MTVFHGEFLDHIDMMAGSMDSLMKKQMILLEAKQLTFTMT